MSSMENARTNGFSLTNRGISMHTHRHSKDIHWSVSHKQTTLKEYTAEFVCTGRKWLLTFQM